MRHRKSFQSSHYNAIGNNQPYEHRKLFTDIIHKSFEHLIDQGHQYPEYEAYRDPFATTLTIKDNRRLLRANLDQGVWHDLHGLRALRFVANEHNIKNVGELPLSEQVAAMTGEDQRFWKIYMFCNPLTAAKMINYSDAFSAYLPCRVSLVEDLQGKLWIYSLNMDMMIHGGASLPPELFDEANSIKETILDIMNRGAEGEF